MKTGQTFSRGGITMKVLHVLRPDLIVAIDHAGNYRLHTGAKKSGFRGYSGEWFTKKRGRCIRVFAFDHETGFKWRRLCKTKRGALNSIMRAAHIIGKA